MVVSKPHDCILWSINCEFKNYSRINGISYSFTNIEKHVKLNITLCVPEEAKSSCGFEITGRSTLIHFVGELLL